MVLFEDIEWYNICEPTEFADFGSIGDRISVDRIF